MVVPTIKAMYVSQNILSCTIGHSYPQLNGSSLLGNELKVDRANERKERPRPTDDRRGGGGYNSYDRSRNSYDRGGYDRGSYDSRDRGNSGYDSRERGGSYRSGGYEGEQINFELLFWRYAPELIRV